MFFSPWPTQASSAFKARRAYLQPPVHLRTPFGARNPTVAMVVTIRAARGCAITETKSVGAAPPRCRAHDNHTASDEISVEGPMTALQRKAVERAESGSRPDLPLFLPLVAEPRTARRAGIRPLVSPKNVGRCATVDERIYRNKPIGAATTLLIALKGRRGWTE
jgi:hypothetical protein